METYCIFLLAGEILFYKKCQPSSASSNLNPSGDPKPLSNHNMYSVAPVFLDSGKVICSCTVDSFSKRFKSLKSFVNSMSKLKYKT
jgi:hypothetical protein